RPGEKLHEVLITEDDARNTVELPDRYAIEPAFAFWATHNFLQMGAEKVPERFRYASDTNRDRLDAESFRAMLTRLA
ncbi:MAG: UDP-N-acetylglucosamine 4,6-dehydratase (inverting), partial [Alphaproteobacteria bacterium]